VQKDEEKRIGLRDRKKLKTRISVQQHAMRLFRQQGYSATTVEQIAEAAEISPSTFFRYFPTKESVVLTDFYDPLLIEAFLSQPQDLPPLEALRSAIKEAFANMSADESASEIERSRLILSVPELRVAALSNLFGTFDAMADALAKRTHRKPDEPAVRMFVGAFFGIAMAVGTIWLENPDNDMIAAMDTAIAYLEQGLPLTDLM